MTSTTEDEHAPKETSVAGLKVPVIDESDSGLRFLPVRFVRLPNRSFTLEAWNTFSGEWQRVPLVVPELKEDS